jgi:SAM-dependent methyltransferase
VSHRKIDELAVRTCPCCGDDGAHVIYRVRAVPVHSCVLLQTAADARVFPRRDLELAFCEVCGFLFNHLFDENVMSYSTNFEESQHFSDTFSSFACKLAKKIVKKCDLMGKSIVEIGCGKGEFIAKLCSLAHANGVGIDPGYRPDPGRCQGANVRFIVDRYGIAYQSIPADLVLCRHTLEHIPDVSAFIRSIREAIAGREDVWIVFQTPDAKRVLNEGAFWDIYYEHCSYFSAGTHARLFRRERFDVTELSVVYHGQYIVQYARPAAFVTTPRWRGEADLKAMQRLTADFPDRVRNAQSKWKRRIQDAALEGRSIVIWGGGSKGVSFLTTLGLEDEIQAVVDINPYRQGKYMPGSGHEIVAPSRLTAIRPDMVVLMNPIYKPEVQANLATLGLKPQILSV